MLLAVQWRHAPLFAKLVPTTARTQCSDSRWSNQAKQHQLPPLLDLSNLIASNGLEYTVEFVAVLVVLVRHIIGSAQHRESESSDILVMREVWRQPS
jgi:hypothetical protein